MLIFVGQEVRFLRDMKWPGGQVPLSEPPCGFRGEKCVSKYTLVPTIIYSAFLALSVKASVNSGSSKEIFGEYPMTLISALHEFFF